MDLTRWSDADLESWSKSLSEKVSAAFRRGWRSSLKGGLQIFGLLVIGFGGVAELVNHGLNYWAAAGLAIGTGAGYWMHRDTREFTETRALYQDVLAEIERRRQQSRAHPGDDVPLVGITTEKRESMFALLDALETASYVMAFQYMGPARESLAEAEALLNGDLAEWRDEDAQRVRAWVKFAWPINAPKDDRARHVASSVWKARGIVRRRCLKTVGINWTEESSIVRWPEDLSKIKVVISGPQDE